MEIPDRNSGPRKARNAELILEVEEFTKVKKVGESKGCKERMNHVDRSVNFFT